MSPGNAGLEIDAVDGVLDIGEGDQQGVFHALQGRSQVGNALLKGGGHAAISMVQVVRWPG